MMFNTNFLNAIPFSDITVQIALAAGVAQTYTVPGDNSVQYRAEFSININDNVWVGYGVTAVTPSAGTLVGNSRIERNPTIRYIRGGDVLSFKSAAVVTDAGLSLLVVPG